MDPWALTLWSIHMFRNKAWYSNKWHTGFAVARYPLLWRHNGHDSDSNHQPHGCLLNRLFRRRSRKTSKLRVTGLCVGNSPGTGEFPAQMACNAENVSIWWRHHVEVLETERIHQLQTRSVDYISNSKNYFATSQILNKHFNYVTKTNSMYQISPF